ncbi:hypothetical protein RRG08_027338 [Elysia crispata]|uniref:Uncharacterized protein n=1 Tax=Elysia crispata TaxID=231223 RepID=A0AAE1DKC6_9GAST|nr:hypothetical protein RRG08_027338 [Elysia crispata]
MGPLPRFTTLRLDGMVHLRISNSLTQAAGCNPGCNPDMDNQAMVIREPTHRHEYQILKRFNQIEKKKIILIQVPRC